MNPAKRPAGAFSLGLDVVGPDALITLRGRLDDSAVTDLGTILGRAVDHGCSSVVLDVSGLDLLPPSAPACIAHTARRMAAGGGTLSIRSPSRSVRRRLVLDGLADLIGDLGPTPAAETVSGPGGSGFDGTPTDQDRTLGPPSSDPTIGALPTADDLIDATLHLVVALARVTVPAADGVSVSLRRSGHLATVAASDQTVLDMDTEQYATGEGPCVDASREGIGFHAMSLDAEARWPAFTPRAMALGIGSILSSPLAASGRPVGALNIYAHRPLAFASADQRLAMRFATEVSAVLTGAGLGATDEQRSVQVRDSLRAREIVAQAQGVLMERRGFSGDQAFTALRVHSQRTGLALSALADQVTGSTRVPPTLAGAPDAGDTRG